MANPEVNKAQGEQQTKGKKKGKAQSMLPPPTPAAAAIAPSDDGAENPFVQCVSRKCRNLKKKLDRIKGLEQTDKVGAHTYT